MRKKSTSGVDATTVDTPSGGSTDKHSRSRNSSDSRSRNPKRKRPISKPSGKPVNRVMTLLPITEPGRGVVTPFGHADKQYNSYLATLALEDAGSHKGEAVRNAMAASEDQRFSTFLEMLQRPTARHRTLAAIAKHCNISLIEMMEFTKKAYHMQTVSRSMAGVLDLTEDLISDSLNKHTPCDRCDGLKFVWCEKLPPQLAAAANVRVVKGERTNSEGKTVMADVYIRDCPSCGGTGLGVTSGSTDARRLLIEQAGGTKKQGGSAVTINFGGAGIESAVGRMKDITFDIEPDPEPPL